MKDIIPYLNYKNMKRGVDYIGVGAGAIIFNNEGKVFISQRGPGARNESGKWDFPGGGVEFGERCEDAVVREIKEEFEAARIRFIMAHQIEYLPKKYFNLTISISTLHEMTRKQISNYIKQINRLTNGYFYNKQWIRSYAKDNSYIREDEYPIPKNWRTIYQRPHPIQRLFFEALYET